MGDGTVKPKMNYSANTAPQKDNCQTPPYAVDLLLDTTRLSGRIWEPAPGDGLLARRLRERKYDVLTTDTDFFYTTPPGVGSLHVVDWLVTNPPFSQKYKWLERCYDLAMPFALLMPSDTLFAGGAQRLFKRYGINVLIPNRRINFKMPNKGWKSSAQMSTSWFVYIPGICRVTTLFVDLNAWKRDELEAWEMEP